MVKSKIVTFARNTKVSIIGNDIKLAKQLLDQNKLVAVPTETVYGLAGNATKDETVTQIFKVKNRPSFDPLIIHTCSLDRLDEYVMGVPDKAKLLADRFWPGPLTLLLPKKNVIPDLVTSGLDTVAVRIPGHPLTLELLESLDYPLAAPSANPFGYISPTTANHVNDQLGEQIDYIVDGGSCAIGIESTIIGFKSEDVIIHRLGGMSIEKIESIVGKVSINEHSSSNPAAPGMLKNHYSPNKRVIIGNIEELLKLHENAGVLSFNRKSDIPHQIQLSADGNLDQAAQNLFGALRTLDKMDIDIIVTEYAPNHGLGRAINDRLERAAADK